MTLNRRIKRNLNKRLRRPRGAPLKISEWKTEVLRKWEENGVEYNSHRHYFSITCANEEAHIHTHDTVEDSGGGGYCGVGVNHDHNCTVNAGSAHNHVFSGYTGITTASDLSHTHTISITSQVGSAHQHNLPANWSSSFCAAAGCEADPHLHVAGGANANEDLHTHALAGVTDNGVGLLRWHSHLVNFPSESGSAHTHLGGAATVSDVSCHTGYLHDHGDLLDESSTENIHVHDVLGDTEDEGEPVDGSTDLYAEFEVGQGAVDLPAEFFVTRAGSVNLHGEFIVIHSASVDLKAEFRVRCSRRFGGNWQRKMWHTGGYYWRGRYCPTHDRLEFEYIAEDGLAGNVWAENVAARIDASGFTGIDADFTVRGAGQGIPTTIHYSDGVDTWIAESDESSVTGWAWENLTKVFDATLDNYRKVNLAANRTTPIPRLWAIAAFFNQVDGKRWVKARRQSTGGDLLNWDGEVPVSNVANTSTIYGCSVRAMGDAGLLKDDMMFIYKEGIAIRSRYYDGDWDDPIEDVDTTTLEGRAAWDFEQGEVAGNYEGHIVYVDADGSIQWRERDSGAGSAWSGAEQLEVAAVSHFGVGIVEHGPGWLWVIWVHADVFEYRLHLCAPESWYPLLANPALIFDPATDAVITTTTIEQPQTPDSIHAGDAVPICWVGQTAPGSPCGLGWGILRGAAEEDLHGEFIVRHSASEDLAAWFDAQVSLNLLGEFIVRQEASRDLPAQFEVAQGAENLPGEFIARHSASVDLAAGFEGMVRRDLPAEFVVRRSDLRNLPAEFVVARGVGNIPAEFIVRHETFVALKLHGDFNIRHTATVDLPAEFFIVNAGAEDLPAEFIIRHETSVELLGEFEVRQETSADLKAIFDIGQGAADLLGFFDVGHNSVDLPAEFVVRHVGTPVDLLGEFAVNQFNAAVNLLGEFVVRHSQPHPGLTSIIAYEPSAFFNYFEGVGTGFLHPQYRPDAEVKVIGQTSLRIRVKYLPSGFDYIQFGWKYRNPIWGEDTWPGTGLGSLNLHGEFVIRRSASMDLPAKFIVGQGSVDLKASFESQVSLYLPGEFIVRQETSVDLSAKFIVRHTSNGGGHPGEAPSADLKAEFWVRQGFIDLPCQFEVMVDRFTLIEEQIVTGAAVGRVTFTGLDLNTHKNYVLIMEWYNPVDWFGHVLAYYNGDEVKTNYRSQYLRGSGASATANDYDTPCVAFGTALKSSMAVINIGISPGGYINAVSQNRVSQGSVPGSVLEIWEVAQNHDVVQANLTELVLSWTRAGAAEDDGFGVGSKFRLYGYKS